MKNSPSILLTAAVIAAVATLASVDASASILITEVDSAGSNTTTYVADWFELTNTGASAVNITGWKIDDNSNSFAAAVALTGINSINAGQSVVFIEGGGTQITNFKSAWFGSSVPAGFAIGSYSGSGVGLSSNGSDSVNIFDSGGTLVTRVDFNATPNGKSFDNAAGIGSTVLPAATVQNAVISQLSAVGVNGAFNSVAGNEIGSPGVAPVPEPESYALMLAGLGLLGFIVRRRQNA